jgi:hypothetical protein
LDEVQTKGAPVESRLRVVVPYFGRETGDFVAGNVRGVGYDEVEDAFSARTEEVSENDPDRVRRPEGCGVSGGQGRGGKGPVQGHDADSGNPDSGCHGQDSRAAAKVQKTRRQALGAASQEICNGQICKVLGFKAREKDVRGHGEVEGVELFSTQDACQGFVAEAAREQSPKAPRLGFRDCMAGLG